MGLAPPACPAPGQRETQKCPHPHHQKKKKKPSDPKMQVLKDLGGVLRWAHLEGHDMLSTVSTHTHLGYGASSELSSLVKLQVERCMSDVKYCFGSSVWKLVKSG